MGAAALHTLYTPNRACHWAPLFKLCWCCTDTGLRLLHWSAMLQRWATAACVLTPADTAGWCCCCCLSWLCWLCPPAHRHMHPLHCTQQQQQQYLCQVTMSVAVAVQRPAHPQCPLATNPLVSCWCASSSGSFGETHIGDWYADTQAMLQYLSHRQPTGKKVIIGAARSPGQGCVGGGALGTGGLGHIS